MSADPLAPPREVLDLLQPFDFASMYELGNKKTYLNNDTTQICRSWAEYFAGLNIEYTSIDLNGMDGALALDLNEPINHLMPRDLVSNIGTTEHVLNQKQVFENIHNLSSRRMIHWVPLERCHPTHGLYGYSPEFFLSLSRVNQYTIDKLYIETRYSGWTLICCNLIKPDIPQPFQWSKHIHLVANTVGDWGIRNSH